MGAAGGGVIVVPPPPESLLEKLKRLISSIIFQEKTSFFQSPKSLKIFWFLQFLLAILIPIYNYVELNPASRNIWAWAAWVGSLITASAIYRASRSHGSYKQKKLKNYEPHPNQGGGPPEPNKNGKVICNIIFVISNMIFLFITITVVLALFVYKIKIFYTEEELENHRSQVKQADCNYYKKAFLQNSDKRNYSSNKFIPKLEHPSLNEKDSIDCSMLIEPYYTKLNFITWLFILEDYIGATSTGVILVNDNVIEARAIWLPIRVPWHPWNTKQLNYSKKNSIEHNIKPIENIANGSISCFNSKARLEMSNKNTPNSVYYADASLSEASIDKDNHKIIIAMIETKLNLKQLQFETNSFSFGEKIFLVLRDEKNFQFTCNEHTPGAISDKSVIKKDFKHEKISLPSHLFMLMRVS